MTLLFMHIPKTAGTSLREALSSVYSAEERVFLYPPSELEGAITPETLAAMPLDSKRRLRLVMGHFHFGIHQLLPQPCHYATVVREPVARVVSLYRFYQRVQPTWVGGMSVTEWAESGKSLQADNEMVRTISGRGGVRFGECSDGVLEEARRNMVGWFDAILHSERLGADALAELTGRAVPAIGRQNVAPDRFPIDKQTRQRLAELNRFDVALYAGI